MPSPRSARLLATVVPIVTVLSLAACTDSDDAEGTTTPGTTVSTSTPTSGSSVTPTAGSTVDDRDAFVAAAAEEMTLGDEAMSTCLAGALVDVVGMDAIVAAGLSPTEFARASSLEEMGLPAALDDPEALQADLAGCGDLVGVFASTEGDDDTAEAACIREGLTNDLAAETVVADLTGGEPSAELIAARDAIGECILGTTATT